MNRRSFLKGSASAAAMAVGGGIVTKAAMPVLSGLDRAQFYESGLIFNIDPVQTPFMSYDLASKVGDFSSVVTGRKVDGVSNVDDVHQWQTDELSTFTESKSRGMISIEWDEGSKD